MDTPPPAPSSSSSSSKGDEPPAAPLGKQIGDWLRVSPALHAVVIVMLALGAVSLAVWRKLDVARVERRASQERAAILQAASEALTAQTSSLLRLSALPLDWAVRSALLKDDMDSVDTYLQRIARERHVTGAALIGLDGKVSRASSRKLKKHAAQEVFPGIDVDAQSPAVVPAEHDLRVVVPVMGYDRRLATLVLSYVRPALEDLTGAAIPHP